MDSLICLQDIRGNDEPIDTIKLSSSVRDVKFGPPNSDLIVVALENGAVEVYDRRNVSRCLTSNTSAHRVILQIMIFHRPNSFQSWQY